MIYKSYITIPYIVSTIYILLYNFHECLDILRLIIKNEVQVKYTCAYCIPISFKYQICHKLTAAPSYQHESNISLLNNF